jgi:hypothetical protein
VNESTKEGGNAITQVTQQTPTQLMTFNPAVVISQAQEAAKALTDVLGNKKKPVMMNGEQYLEYEDWQLLAKFYDYTVGTESTTEIVRNGEVVGFTAKSVVYQRGVVVSSAEASCSRDEDKWNKRDKYKWINGQKKKVGEEKVPDFQLKSMAQTRACAKGLRNVLAWVVVLAGYKATPAEEMDGVENRQPVRPKSVAPQRPVNKFAKLDEMPLDELKRRLVNAKEQGADDPEHKYHDFYVYASGRLRKLEAQKIMDEE